MKKLKVGIAGLGEFGELYAVILSNLAYVDLRRVCSRTESRVREIADRYGVPEISTDYEEFAFADDLDVVCVTTLGKDHRNIVVNALKAGKHVLVEKPVADDLEDADAMVEAAKAAEGQFMVAHICRFMAPYYKAKQSIAAGDIGDIVMIQAQRNNHYSVLAPGKKKNPMRETAIHDIDLAMWFTESSIVESQGYRKFNRSGEEADCCLATVKFADGAIASFASSWLMRDASPAGVDARMTIIGTKGQIRIQCPPESFAFINDCENSFFNPETALDPVTIRQTALNTEIEYFLKCVATGAVPDMISPEEARNTLAAAIEIDRNCIDVRS